MKIRTDFVTNSSSSSFIACGVWSEELAAWVIELLDGKNYSYSKHQVGCLSVDNDIVSVTTTLDAFDYHLHRKWEDDYDTRTAREKAEDNDAANNSTEIAEALSVFLPELTSDQHAHLVELLEVAEDTGNTVAEVYLDMTDGWNDRKFLPWDFRSNVQGRKDAYARAAEQQWLADSGDLITKEPLIYFTDSLFVFSGFGRGDDGKSDPLVEEVIKRGGIFRGEVSGKIHYLVIDPAYAGASKIKAVADLREKGIFVDVILKNDLEKALKEKRSEAQEAEIKEKVLRKREREAEARRVKKEKEDQIRRQEQAKKEEIRRQAQKEERMVLRQVREAQKAEEKAKRGAYIAQTLLSIQEQCIAKGKKYLAISEFYADMKRAELGFAEIERYIYDQYQQKIADYLTQNGMLMTEKERVLAQIEEVLDTLSQRYVRMNRKTMSVRDVAKENPDVDMRVLTEHAAFYTGKTPRVLLTERGIIYRDEEQQPKDVPVSRQIDVTQIPENIRKRMDTLFGKLDEAYPDKVIVHLNRDHKTWGETVTALYRDLGYESPKDFLTAYGYTYAAADDKGGRPKKNPTEIIEELQRRYPNGSDFTTVDELKAANPDIASRFQSLRNKSNEYFGMPFTQYLRSIGLIK